MDVFTNEEVIAGTAQAAWLGDTRATASTRNRRREWFAKAEACYRKAIDKNPRDSIAHNNLGWAREMKGDRDGALPSYRRALELDPRLRTARRNLATLLVRLGRRDEAFQLFNEELRAGSDGLAWIQGLISTTMRSRDLALAGD